jgi:hypothetical protein
LDTNWSISGEYWTEVQSETEGVFTISATLEMPRKLFYQPTVSLAMGNDEVTSWFFRSNGFSSGFEEKPLREAIEELYPAPSSLISATWREVIPPIFERNIMIFSCSRPF